MSAEDLNSDPSIEQTEKKKNQDTPFSCAYTLASTAAKIKSQAMETVGEFQRQEKRRLRLVFFPCPLQGHINPMLQLATLLHSKGFSITIVHTVLNFPISSNYPNFTFLTIPDGLSDAQTSLVTTDVIALVSLLNVNCVVPFRDCLARLLSDNSQDPISCLISDAIMHFTQGVANSFKLPRIVLRTSSPTSFIAFAAFPLLRQMGYLPVPDSQLDSPLPGLPPLRVKDIPVVTTSDPEKLYQLVDGMVNETKVSSGLIWNTFEHLDQSALATIRQDFPIPVFSIGPLHKLFPSSSSSLLTQDHSCITWLDTQPHNSVLYVSFGSLAAMDDSELVETAWGLANSGVSFLWVVRPGSVRGTEWTESLPEGFLEMTRGRGCIVKWAPQQEVLAHPAVGGFWTHNGWNSTLESLCEGVPMICSPCFGDQPVNARYVSHVWRVGVRLENGFKRKEIEMAIKKMMTGKEAEEMRERIMNLKEKAELCLKTEGSSNESLESLIACLMSFHDS